MFQKVRNDFGDVLLVAKAGIRTYFCLETVSLFPLFAPNRPATLKLLASWCTREIIIPFLFFISAATMPNQKVIHQDQEETESTNNKNERNEERELQQQ